MMNGKQLYSLLQAGSQHLEAKKQLINRINVFPIADQDTGSNMAYTLRMAIETCDISEDYSKMIHHIAQQATYYAKGNSGIILAQFLQGMSYIHHSHEIDKESFINSIQKAANRLYEVVDNPIDGTILSVIKDWSYSFDKQSELSLEKQCLSSIRYLNLSLSQTKKQMIALRHHDVFDAGGLGFYYIIEGICYALDQNQVRLKKIERRKQLKTTHHTDEYRYCCQFMIKKDKEAISKLRECPCGSLVYTSNDRYMNVHLHTNEPCVISDCLAKCTHINDVKVEDMKQQCSIAKGKIAILTDTIADIDIENMEDVYWLAMSLCIDESIYLDKHTKKVDSFLHQIKSSKEKVTSSQPNQAQLHYLLERLLDKYEKVIIICVSSHLSGCCANIRQYLKSHSELALKVFLVDSQLNSVAQGLLVKKTQEYLNHCQDIQEILMYIHNLKQRIKTYVYVGDFHQLKHSGRVPIRIAQMADKLHLKAILTLDHGKAKIFGYGLTKEKIEDKMISKISHDEIEEYAFCYCDKKEVATYSKKIRELLNFNPEYSIPTSCITALNVGENAYAIGYIVKEKRHG